MQTLSEDDQRCLECDYHFLKGELVTCEYLVRTGERRGCKPGLGCKRFKRGCRALQNPVAKQPKKQTTREPKKQLAREPRNKQPLTGEPQKQIAKIPNGNNIGQMVPIDREKLEELRQLAGSYSAVLRAIGLSEIARAGRTLGDYRRRGVGNKTVAALILAEYGIDIQGDGELPSTPENLHQIYGRMGGRPKSPDMVEADREKLEELRGKAGSLNRASKALGFQEMRLNVAYYSGWVNIQVAEAVAREYGIDIRLPPGKQQTEKVSHKAKIKKIPENFDAAVQAVATQGLTWKEGAAMCGLNPQAFRGLARHKLGIQDVRRRRNIEKLDEQGNMIATYDSVYEAAEQEGYTGAYICRLCREGQKYRYKGASSTASGQDEGL
jgi:hypothetical protein